MRTIIIDIIITLPLYHTIVIFFPFQKIDKRLEIINE